MEYKLIKGTPDESTLKEIVRLEGLCFEAPQYDLDRLRHEYGNKGEALTILAIDSDGELCGYKIGYERRLCHFYSWLGGVAPAYRKQGIAGQLMAQQHAYIKQNGYKNVRTQTGNEYRSMLLLNIKNGFDIIGTTINKRGLVRIILDKKL
ncbi:MAG: GNAT family N-acetyltransferase [Halobacteriovoraceae bacterium]|jgi:ribosomal protein S18 acetylase RimI-like enzyme|nr:GNAT family N-acetyltransferase [Halobacteriovoraceae bacterium]MBT5095856.1 GNAT family N-acetyltransferase [Halobacteriovoraceae bacterium]